MISEKHMLGFIVVFLSSALWPSLPNYYIISLAFIVLIANALVGLSAILCGGIIGLFWASISGYFYTTWQIDNSYFKQTLIVEGTVLSLMHLQSPNHTNYKNSIKLELALNKIGREKMLLKPKVRLSWYQPHFAIKQGNKLKLLVRLKPPLGLANPDGFNYQQWLVSKNIAALGYVKKSPSNAKVSSNSTMRQQLVDQLQSKKMSHIKWVLALTYGDRQLLEADDWALMQRTGTAHLFAISGMHLGIVFAFVLLAGKASFVGFHFANMGVNASVMPFNKNLVLQKNISFPLMLIALVFASLYAFIAGFEIPVMRALIMLLLWATLIVFQRHWRPTTVLLSLFTIFFILFPYSILGISFWFSFIAVLVIMFYTWRFPILPNANLFNRLCYALKLQLFISLFTLPMLAIAFNSLPLWSFFANVVMIPLVTFLLVPMCLIAALLDIASVSSSLLYNLINETFRYVFIGLNWFDSVLINDFSQHFLAQVFSESTQNKINKLLLATLQNPIVIMLLFLLYLPNWQHKNKVLSFLFLCSFLPIIFTWSRNENSKTWQLYVFDVGQGSALVLKRNNKFIVYDTGGAFAGFSMAQSVLLPFFKKHEVEDIELLIISHFDNDHAGGLNLLSNRFNIAKLLTPKQGCNLIDNPKPITALGLKITVLWPLAAISGELNNHSCVIKISDQKHSILLSGDIEKSAEAKIINHYSGSSSLRADVLVAPHHGSKTSSSMPFVNAVSPKYALFTAGLNNRWQFPAYEVLARYKQINANILITGYDGRILATFTHNEIVMSAYRKDEYKRWYFSTM